MIYRGLKITMMLLAATSLGCWSSACMAALITPVAFALQPCSGGLSLYQAAEQVAVDGAWDLGNCDGGHDPVPVQPRNERFAWYVPSGTAGDMGGSGGFTIGSSVVTAAWLPPADLWKGEQAFSAIAMQSSELPDWQLGGRLFRPPRCSRRVDGRLLFSA